MFKKAKENKKGFTLAELLIVVAIIAVLVAISIPIFTSQLEKSRDAVSIANLRAAYAEAASDYLTAGTSGDTNIPKTVTLKGKKSDNFSSLGTELPFNLDSSLIAKDGTVGEITVTFAFDEDATGKQWTAKVVA